MYVYTYSEWVSSGPWPQLSEDDWEGQIATHGSCGWLVGLVLVHYEELISKTVTFALIIIEMEPSCVNVCHSLCGVSVSAPEQQQQICNKTAGRGVRPRTSCTWWDPLIEKVTSFLAKNLARSHLKSPTHSGTLLWRNLCIYIPTQDLLFPNEYEYIYTYSNWLLACFQAKVRMGIGTQQPKFQLPTQNQTQNNYIETVMRGYNTSGPS